MGNEERLIKIGSIYRPVIPVDYFYGYHIMQLLKIKRKLMASQKVQYLRCAASFVIAAYCMYGRRNAGPQDLRALILNFFLCHLNFDFLRVRLN